MYRAGGSSIKSNKSENELAGITLESTCSSNGLNQLPLCEIASAAKRIVLCVVCCVVFCCVRASEKFLQKRIEIMRKINLRRFISAKQPILTLCIQVCRCSATGRMYCTAKMSVIFLNADVPPIKTGDLIEEELQI